MTPSPAAPAAPAVPAAPAPAALAPASTRGRRAAVGAAMLFVTASIWGSQFPIAKGAFEVVDPYYVTLFRYSVGAVLLLGLLLWREGLVALRFDRLARDATFYGVLGMCFSPALTFGGLAMTRPEVAAIIVATQPTSTAVALWLVRGQRPSLLSLACIVVAFLGVVTIVTRWGLAAAPTAEELIGFAMIFTGSLCWVAYTIASDRFGSWSTLRLTALTMLPGSLATLALVIALTLFGLISAPAAEDWLAIRYELLFLSLLGVMAAMMMWNAGTLRIGALNAMLFLNLIPVAAFTVRYLQGYRFHPIELIGASLVIGALIVNNLALRRRLG